MGERGLDRGYQYDFSCISAGMHDVVGRERKAKTMVSVFEDYTQGALSDLSLLDIGGSAGIIDNYLAEHFKFVVGLDIDEKAITKAKNEFQKDNLVFYLGDACNLQFEDCSYDVVICSQVYEHVPSPEKMMSEIYRVLAPGGICYFSASNRLMWNEPHYNLPLLSVIPRFLAHLYIKWANKADHYHELHYTYWGLKRLVKSFNIHDYTKTIIYNPAKYHVDYMIKSGSMKTTIARLVSSKLLWLCPGYIWLLEKPK